jgi:hypothetical protein
MNDVFLSYAATEASATVKRLAEDLERAGLTVWHDVGVRSLGETSLDLRIPAGSTVDEALRSAIDDAATFVFVDTPAWWANDYCRFEYEHAMRRGKRIVRAEPDGNVKDLVEDIRIHLDIGRAHARILTEAPGVPWWRLGEARQLHADALRLAHADLRAQGLRPVSEVDALIDDVLAGARRRQRAGIVLATIVLAFVTAGATVGLVARAHAIDRNRRAHAEAKQLRALALATDSSHAPDTLQQIRLASQAVHLHRDDSTIAALRAGVQAFDGGVDLRAPISSSPVAGAISNSGRTVAVVSEDRGLVVIRIGRTVRTRSLPAATVAALPQVAVSPSGGHVALVRDDGGATEVVDARTGRVLVVPQTDDVADVTFVSDNRLVMVRRDGAVLTTDPRHPTTIRRVGDTTPEVRAAAVIARPTGGVLSVAALHDDGTIDARRLGVAHVDQPWVTSLHDLPDAPALPGSYAVGADHLRVCGDHLHVVTTGQERPFELTFAIGGDGQASYTGSMLRSFGSLCLPTGDVLFDDVVRGQESSPSSGWTYFGFASETQTNIRYAIASSDDGRWAVSAGSDGVLAVRRLAVATMTRRLPQVDVVVGDGEAALAAGRTGMVESSRLGTHHIALPPDVDRSATTARGAFEDATAGAVIGWGHDLLVIRDGDVRSDVRTAHDLAGIRPAVPGRSALAVTGDRQWVLELPLDGRQRPLRELRLPATLFEHGRFIWDAAMTSAGNYAIARSDGHVLVLSPHDGHVLEDRVVGPPGRTILAAVTGERLAVGSENGVVTLIDDRTLARIRSVKAVQEMVADLATDPATGRIVARTFEGHVVVLTVPALEILARLGPATALVSATLAARGTKVIFGTNLSFADGKADASVGAWSICAACGGNPSQLAHTAVALIRGRATADRETFRPEAQASPREAASVQGPALVLNGKGFNDVRVGTAATKVQAAAVAVLGPPDHQRYSGCELGGPGFVYSERTWTWGGLDLIFSNKATTPVVAPGSFTGWSVVAKAGLPRHARLPARVTPDSTMAEIKRAVRVASSQEGLPGTRVITGSDGIEYAFSAPRYQRVTSISLNAPICE